MTKASLQKQTVFILFLYTLFLLPNLSIAQSHLCDSLIEEVTVQYEAPPDTTRDGICDYTSTIHENTSNGCKTPQNVNFNIIGNLVEVTWDIVPNANQYRIDYINTTTGAATYNLTIDQPPLTIGPLDPGVYIFALRAVCDGAYSEPSIHVGPVNPIIVDVIGALTAPQDESDCFCTPQDQNAVHNETTSGVSDFGWQGAPFNCTEKYDLRIRVTLQGTPYNMKAKLIRGVGGGSNQMRIIQCSDNDQIELRTTSQQNEFKGVDKVGNEELFKLNMHSLGVVITPTVAITGNPGNQYQMIVHSCCPLSGGANGGSGSGKGKKEEFNQEGNSSSRSSGLLEGEAMKSQLLSAPNPFKHQTTISYTLPMDSELSLRLYNAIGQQVQELQYGFHPAGTYQVPLEGEDLQSGIYYLRLKTKTQDELVKMVKL